MQSTTPRHQYGQTREKDRVELKDSHSLESEELQSDDQVYRRSLRRVYKAMKVDDDNLSALKVIEVSGMRDIVLNHLETCNWWHRSDIPMAVYDIFKSRVLRIDVPDIIDPVGGIMRGIS